MEVLTVLQAIDVMEQEYNSPITAGSLRAWIRCGKCPFGVYIKDEGRTQGRYLVFKQRMDEYFRPKHGVHNPLVIAQERQIYFM